MHAVAHNFQEEHEQELCHSHKHT